MGSVYWKVVAEEGACERLAFFALDRKWKYKVIPMGELNAA